MLQKEYISSLNFITAGHLLGHPALLSKFIFQQGVLSFPCATLIAPLWWWSWQSLCRL